MSHRANGQALDSVLNFMEIFAPWQDAKGIIRLGPVVRNVNSNLMLAIKGYLGSPSFRQYDQMGEIAKFLLNAVAQLAICLKVKVNFRAKKAFNVMAQQRLLLKKHGGDALLLDFDEATIAHILTELGVDSSRVTAMPNGESTRDQLARLQADVRMPFPGGSSFPSAPRGIPVAQAKTPVWQRHRVLQDPGSETEEDDESGAQIPAVYAAPSVPPMFVPVADEDDEGAPSPSELAQWQANEDALEGAVEGAAERAASAAPITAPIAAPIRPVPTFVAAPVTTPIITPVTAPAWPKRPRLSATPLDRMSPLEFLERVGVPSEGAQVLAGMHQSDGPQAALLFAKQTPSGPRAILAASERSSAAISDDIEPDPNDVNNTRFNIVKLLHGRHHGCKTLDRVRDLMTSENGWRLILPLLRDTDDQGRMTIRNGGLPLDPTRMRHASNPHPASLPDTHGTQLTPPHPLLP